MGNSLKQLALVLQAAEQLYDEGKLEKPDYLRLVSNVETNYRDSSYFVKDLKNWAKELLHTDRAVNHERNLDTLLVSYLESPDADDHEKRVEVLQLVKLFKKILTTSQGYDQKLLLNQLNRI